MTHSESKPAASAARAMPDRRGRSSGVPSG